MSRHQSGACDGVHVCFEHTVGERSFRQSRCSRFTHLFKELAAGALAQARPMNLTTSDLCCMTKQHQQCFQLVMNTTPPRHGLVARAECRFRSPCRALTRNSSVQLRPMHPPDALSPPTRASATQCSPHASMRNGNRAQKRCLRAAQADSCQPTPRSEQKLPEPNTVHADAGPTCKGSGPQPAARSDSAESWEADPQKSTMGMHMSRGHGRAPGARPGLRMRLAAKAKAGQPAYRALRCARALSSSIL